MERLVGFPLIACLVLMAAGFFIAPLRMIFHVVEFVGMIPLITLVGRLVASWFCI